MTTTVSPSDLAVDPDPWDAMLDPKAWATLDRDVRDSAASLADEEARFLVDLYYRLQEHRIATGHQTRTLKEAGRPASVMQHFHERIGVLEKHMPKILGVYADAHEVGRWSLAQKGIGPVLAAGLLAHIDITRAPTVGHIWRYAGLDPSVTWNKGERRPWNADLKLLCWKIGDSFVKVQRYDDAFYGRLYAARKAEEVAKDESGRNAECAASTLESRKIKDAALRRTYESGHLPAGRIDLRARRWTVKLFLSHWHETAYRAHYGTEPPAPFAIDQLGHAHRIPCPPGA